VNQELNMKIQTLSGLVLLALVSSPLLASQELAEKNGCMGCHLMDRKTVGPSIRQIAERYAAQPDASAMLYEKVKNGGGGPWHGTWGSIPMPPHGDSIQPDTMKTIVDWMLLQK
jgi:cytochrome c